MNVSVEKITTGDLTNFIEAFVEYRRAVEDGGYTFDHFDKNQFQVIPDDETSALLSAMDNAFERMTGRPYSAVRY